MAGVTWVRARGVVATLLVIGWVTTVCASCGSSARHSVTRPKAPASGRAARSAGEEGKGGTQLDFSQPLARSPSPARGPAPTVLQAVPTAQPLQGDDPRVGPLFEPNPSGPHFCTASVVPSPGHDLVMTAAHCVNDGRGHDNLSIVFIPGYSDGVGPYGVWTPRAVIVDPRWANGGDQDYDVGFVVLNAYDGKNIQDLVGANPIDFNAGFTHLVRVTGYPQKQDAPVTCENWTSKYSVTQLRFTCGGFYGGTSGSPWIATGHDSAAHPPQIVGVIGGYQRGGDINTVSYSAYLGSAIEALYQRAEAASAG